MNPSSIRKLSSLEGLRFAAFFCVLLGFFLLAAPAGAQSGEGALKLVLRTGIFLQGQGEDTSINGVETAPIVHSLGAAIGIPLSRIISFEPGLDFFYDEYVYIASQGRAVPTQMETGSVVGPLAGVLGVSLDLPFSFQIPVSESFRFNLMAGLTALFRIPVAALDGTELEELELLGTSMNESLKWLLPQLGVGFGVALDPALDLEFSIRLHVPLWHIWDDRALDFWDSNLLWGRLGLSIALGP